MSETWEAEPDFEKKFEEALKEANISLFADVLNVSFKMSYNVESAY